jgi:Flp pilus assembly protein TadB
MDPATLSLLIPFGAFAMVVAIVFISHRSRDTRQKQHYELVRLALEKGQPIPRELLQPPEEPSTAAVPRKDLRQGLILLAVGAALFMGAGYGIPFFVAALVAFIGIALIVSSLIGSRKPNASPLFEQAFGKAPTTKPTVPPPTA